MTRNKHESTNQIDIENLLLEYDNFLNFLQRDLSIKNISKTKLQKIKSKIKKEVSHYDEICKIYSDINRFKRIMRVLEEKKDNLNRDTLKRMLAGSEHSPFYSDNSEDAFFEFDFASRLINLRSYKSINIETKTDIIFNEVTAIECKKIHSGNSFEENLKKANKQILEKLNSGGRVKNGLIAIDLTNIFNHEKFREFSKHTYRLFLDEYLTLGHTETDCLHAIPRDNNFKGVVQNFSSALLEFSFHSMFKEVSANFQMNKDVMGVFYQAETFIPIETKDTRGLIAIRAGCYYINNQYLSHNDNKYNGEDIGSFLRSLASGI